MEKSNHKPIFDEFGYKRTLLGILVVFFPKKGRFGCNLSQGKLPYFDHTHYPNFRTGFWVRHKGNLVVSPSGKL